MLENWQVDKTFRFILASGVIWWVQNIWWSDPPPWWSHLSEPPGRPSRLVQKGLFQSIEALPIAPCVHQGFGQSLLGDWRGPEDWRIRNWMEPENPISSWFLVLVESLIPVFSHELGWNTLYHKHWLFYQVSGVALLGMVFFFTGGECWRKDAKWSTNSTSFCWEQNHCLSNHWVKMLVGAKTAGGSKSHLYQYTLQ